MSKQRFVFFLLLSLLQCSVAYTGPLTERQKELSDLLYQDCGSCHGLTLKGGCPALLPDSLKNKPDRELIQTILKGRPGTAMPPWEDFLSEEDARWMVEYLLKKEE